jgi:hypothetical protein
MKGLVRAESSAESAAREQAELLREQNRLLAEQNRVAAREAPPAWAEGQARCPSCGKRIDPAPVGSRVPFVHTDPGDFSRCPGGILAQLRGGEEEG